MIDRLRAHLEATALIPAGARVLVGWSGGADSTALLLLLRDLGIDVVAGHLDHAQRDGSAAESKRFGALSESWDIPFAGGRADVPAIAIARKIGIEEAGREARYSFLESARRATGSTLIATGHTRSDHVETVLFHLTRGTGLSGLAGIPTSRDGIVRPLLVFSREETTAFCRERGYVPFEDPGNHDLAHARVRLRSQVMPELKTINPEAEAAIARFAALADEEDRFLDGAAAAGLERAEIPETHELAPLARDVEIAFRCDALAHLPSVLRRRAFRLAVGALGGTLDSGQIAKIETYLAAGSGSVTATGGRIAVMVDGDTLEVRDLNPEIPARYPLALEGETVSEQFGWGFDVHSDVPSDEEPTRRTMRVELDAARVKGGLYLRGAHEGDRMVPFGSERDRPVAELCGKAGLTRGIRQRLPIVCDMLGPLWIPAVALAGRVAKGTETTRVITVEFRVVSSS